MERRVQKASENQGLPVNPKQSRQKTIREAIGVLYEEQFSILLYLTTFYYILVTLKDVFAEPSLSTRLFVADLAVLVLLMALWVLKRIDIVHRGNLYLTPIPIAFAMLINGYMHVYYSLAYLDLVKGVLMIFAFSVVALLPWIFWLLLSIAFLSFTIATLWLMGDDFGPMLVLGIGSAMLAYAGFVTRYNTILKQIDLALINEERADTLAHLSETKDQFIANVSHELRTPLTGLLGMVNLLDAEGLNAEQKKMLKEAKSSANMLKALIGDLLDVSSLEAGKLRLQAAPFDLQEIADSVVGALKVQAKPGVELSAVFPDEKLPVVSGDASRVSQILFNLVGNALKFTNDGTVTLEIKLIKEGDPLSVCISVADTGIGIPLDKQEDLFNRFEQVDSSQTRGTAGIGLGLAISRELVRLMQSDIHLESKVGEGTCFWFDLTLPVAEEPKTKPYGSSIMIADEAQAALEYPLSILLVEDNPVNQLLVSKLLDRKFWHTTIVSDGQQAVTKAEDEEFDLILMDIQMPVMDGETAIQKIKVGNGLNKDTPIFALTANCQHDDIVRYEKLGFNGHISKPIINAEFFGVLADVCYQKVKTPR